MSAYVHVTTHFKWPFINTSTFTSNFLAKKELLYRLQDEILNKVLPIQDKCFNKYQIRKSSAHKTKALSTTPSKAKLQSNTPYA